MFFFLIEMIDEIVEIVLYKTPGLDIPETFVLTNNRFKNFLVLIYSDLRKAHFLKIPYRNNPYHEIEILRSFKQLNLFIPNEHTEDYFNQGPNDKNFLFEIEDRKFVYVGEKLLL